MSPEQLAQLLEKENQAKLQSPLDQLDERELEVFSILAQGFSTAQIESEFGIKRDELKTIKARIQKKLRLKDEKSLLRAAAKSLQVDNRTP